MIFFAPAYDPATHLNLVIVRRILPSGCQALLGAEATRTALLAALEQDGEDTVFAMSHGEKERLLAQNRTTAEELDCEDLGPKEKKDRLEVGKTTALASSDTASVGRRRLFVFACHTASVLGRALTGEGAVYWGYTGAINAPAENPDLAFLFIPIFEYIRDAWHGAGTSRERQNVLVHLATLCTKAEGSLDDLALEDEGLDVGSAYLCLLHIWDRLRIWTRGAESPEHHPSATTPLFLM